MKPSRKLTGVWVFAFLIVLATAAHVWRWGQHVAVAFEPISRSGGSWHYRSLQPPGEAVEAEDFTGDGVVDHMTIRSTAGQMTFLRPTPDAPDARWLVLCLDGVPFSVMQSLWTRGHFREFFPPSPLISTFPSDSETALTDAFHADPVPGYEHRYFDRARNRLRGGMWKTLREEGIGYLRLLDYDQGGIFKGLTYFLPRKAYRADLGRFRKRFLKSSDQLYLAHLATPDSLYHILPADQMEQLLLEVEPVLQELYFRSQGKLRITLFADHGNSLVSSRAVPLAEFLAAHGYRLRDRIEESKDVVVPAYGLVGFIAVYCAKDEAAPLAAVLAELEGVDFLVHSPAPDHAFIESRRGRARLTWKPDGSHLKYEAFTGDPLQLLPPIERLTSLGKQDKEGFIADNDWLLATAQTAYPNAPARIRDWARNHVLNRAELMVSLADGYYYGSTLFQGLVTIRSTHGSLGASQSLGFAMSTDGPLPPVLRSSQLLPPHLPLRHRPTRRWVLTASDRRLERAAAL